MVSSFASKLPVDSAKVEVIEGVFILRFGCKTFQESTFSELQLSDT